MNRPKLFFSQKQTEEKKKRMEQMHFEQSLNERRAKRNSNVFSFFNGIFSKIFRLSYWVFGYLVKGIHFLTISNIQKTYKAGMAFLWQITSFMFLLLAYFAYHLCLYPKASRILQKILGGQGQKKVLNMIFSLINKLDPKKEDQVRKIDLIRLSLRNMQVKKSRTNITIGGITIGIATIVFFVSIGYGLQSMVISRVVHLDELKQADVTSQIGSRVKVNDKSLSEFSHIPGVTSVMPLISVVGEVTYNGSVSDMAVYGVTSNYLTQSAIKPLEGVIFNNNQLVSLLPVESKEVSLSSSPTKQVAGASTMSTVQTVGDVIQHVQFSITPSDWIRVRSGPSTTSSIIGYTKREVGVQTGEEVWGDNYLSATNSAVITHSVSSVGGKILGRWIKSPVFLWQKTKCNPQTQGDCEPGGEYMVMRGSDNTQVQESGYFAQLNLSLIGTDVSPQVLGASTKAGTPALNNDGSMQFVTIASLSAKTQTPEVKTVTLSQKAVKQAVVNQSMLKVLGIDPNHALGKTFSVSFVATGDLLTNPNQKLQSEPADYTIIGVIPGTLTPQFYVPFIDLRSLGITNYSQATVVVNNPNNLDIVRKEIEAKGYNTSSVADTVAQINSVFSFARTILALLGFVALAVASLGMFNTLTVSLLERTREVGLLKTMGMSSEEVKDLFLTESMIMAVMGGVIGIIAGLLLGQLLSVVISLFTVVRGIGLVDVSSVPLTFIIIILFLSVIVGLITGFYPARRATKISALNALRYE